MHMNFLNECKAVPVQVAAATGTALLTSNVVDMQGFSSVAFIAYLDNVTDGSVLTLTMQQGAEADGSDAADSLVAATFTANANNADNMLMVVDAHMPRERYVRATLARDTAGAAVNGIIAVLYNAHHCPVTQDAAVIASTFTNDPALA